MTLLVPEIWAECYLSLVLLRALIFGVFHIAAFFQERISIGFFRCTVFFLILSIIGVLVLNLRRSSQSLGKSLGWGQRVYYLTELNLSLFWSQFGVQGDWINISNPSENWISVVKIGLWISAIVCIIFLSIESVIQSFSMELIFLIGLSVWSLCILLFVDNFLTVYLCLEIQALRSYVLTTGRQQTQSSLEAGFKYFFIGALSSSIFLFGLAYLYQSIGITALDKLRIIFQMFEISTLDVNSKILGGWILVARLFFKLGVGPFHTWVPDVYEGAPRSITAFFSLSPKLAIIVFFLRWFSTNGWLGILSPRYISEYILLLCLSLITLMLGIIGALGQRKLKRLLAYAGVAHLGYILLGYQTNSIIGWRGLLVYITIYGVSRLRVFGRLINRITRYKGKDAERPDLDDWTFSRILGGWWLTVIIFAIFLLAGLPPFGGFIAKWMILNGVVETAFFWSLGFTLLLAALAAVYYLRVIYRWTWNAYRSGSYQIQQWRLFYRLSVLKILLFLFMWNFSFFPQWRIALSEQLISSYFVYRV